MATADLEARLRDSELSRLRAWEQLARIRSVLEALSGRRLPHPERRDFEAEGDTLVGALYEEFSVLLEDLGRLEAFFGQLRPVIGQPLAEEEAEALRLSMLEHLPQHSLRLGEVRLRLERAWRSGVLPPGVERRGFASRGPWVRRRDDSPKGVGEGPPSHQEFPFGRVQGPQRRQRRVRGSKAKVAGAPPTGQGPALQATFVWD